MTLDALEAAALLTAGSRLSRADTRHRAPAAAAAVLLLADACIDLATSATGPELALAVAMAVAVELPLAAYARYLPPARRVVRAELPKLYEQLNVGLVYNAERADTRCEHPPFRQR